MAEKPLTDSINALTAYINEVTGGTDDNLSDAISTLADGYGIGGITADDIAYPQRITDDIVIQSATRVSFYAFYGYSGIKSVRGENVTAMYPYAFYGCASLQSAEFPKLTTFAQSGGNQFNGCSNLTHIYLPIVTNITANTFSNCSKLSVIKLPKCNRITTPAFSNCNALTDIYLPNAASTYTGAPWGATNATIHYNTTFDENGEPVIE